VHDDDRIMLDSVMLHTTPEQDAAMLAFIDESRNRPPDYNVWDLGGGQNCARFVTQVLQAGGIDVPQYLPAAPRYLIAYLHVLAWQQQGAR